MADIDMTQSKIASNTSVLINGLKRTIEVMEVELECRANRIKELEETCYDYLKSITNLECQVSDLSWQLTNSPEERVDW
jgi:hypothetical protein